MQQATFDDLVYEVDVMRNIATRHDEPKESPRTRRASVSAVTFLPIDTISSAPIVDEEEQAVAGRLEIRVVDASGGATVVQTSADKEPLQSKSLKLILIKIDKEIKIVYFVTSVRSG